MNKTIKLSVDQSNIGKRLDIFLSENINSLTRSHIKKMIEDKQVKLNNIVKLKMLMLCVIYAWYQRIYSDVKSLTKLYMIIIFSNKFISDAILLRY